MKKKHFVIILLSIILMLTITGCRNQLGAYDTEDGNGLFVKITTDNANILTTGASRYYYYYLKDTKVVYVGYIPPAGDGNYNFITPVITENGNYCRYDTEKKQVIEIKE